MKKDIKNIFWATFIAVVVSGCAGPTAEPTAEPTVENFEKVLNAMIGWQEIDIIRKEGIPDRIFEVESSRFLTYTKSRTISVGGTNARTITTIGDDGWPTITNVIPGKSGTSVSRSCTTTFELIGGIMKSYQFQGNDCTAYDPDK